MSQDGQSRLEPCVERKCEFALEHGQSVENQTIEIKDRATDARTVDGSRRRLGGIQEEDVVVDEGHMDEDENYQQKQRNTLTTCGRPRPGALMTVTFLL